MTYFMPIKGGLPREKLNMSRSNEPFSSLYIPRSGIQLYDLGKMD
jgi:hypothetical protein